MTQFVFKYVLLAAVMLVHMGAGAQSPYSPGQTFSAGTNPTPAPAGRQNFYNGQSQGQTAPTRRQPQPAQKAASTPYNLERKPAPKSADRAPVKKSSSAEARLSSPRKRTEDVSDVKKAAPEKSVIEKLEVKSEAASVAAEPEAAATEVTADATPAVVAQSKNAIPDSNDKLTFMERKTGKNWIALTYDDGPSPGFTLKLAEYLKSNNVPATFYVLGERVKTYPDVLKKLVADGFEIANHTYTHPDLKRRSADQVTSELQRTHDLVKEVAGVDMKTMRPPYGNHNSTVDEICKDMGYKIIIWDVDTEDWRNRSTDSMVNTIIKGTSDGSIILMHDRKHNGKETVLEVTKKTVEHFRAKGYTFVTVTQLLGLDDAADSGLSAETVATTGAVTLASSDVTSSGDALNQPLPAPAIRTPAPLLP